MSIINPFSFNEYSNAYNQLIVSGTTNLVLSASTNQNVQIIFDLFYSDADFSFTEYIGRFKKYPDSQSGATIDVQRIYSDYIGFDLNSNDSGWYRNDSAINIDVRIGEEYINLSGNTVVLSGQSVNNTALILPTRIDTYDWIEFRNAGPSDINSGWFNDSYITGEIQKKKILYGNIIGTPTLANFGTPLSFAPTEYQYIRSTDKHWMYFLQEFPISASPIINPDSTPISRMVIETYDCDGVLLNKLSTPNQFTTGTTVNNADRYIRFTSGPEQINDLDWYIYSAGPFTDGNFPPGPPVTQPIGTLFTGGTVISPLVCEYCIYTEIYQVTATNSRFNRNMEKYCFKIVNCEPYTTWRLHWTNGVGGIDSYNFDRIDEVSTQVEKQQYNKSQPYNYTYSDFGKKTIVSEWNTNIVAKTNWLTKQESRMIEKLFESPQVWVEVNAELIPVDVNTLQYRKYRNQRDLFRYDVSFSNVFNNYRRL